MWITLMLIGCAISSIAWGYISNKYEGWLVFGICLTVISFHISIYEKES